jgi:hypothetical protein
VLFRSDRPHWVLSSDQIFLAVVKSPRPEHLIAAPSRMANMPDPRLQAVEIALNSILGCYIGVRGLRFRIPVLVHGLNTPPPTGTCRLDYLEWLDQHSLNSLDLLDGMVHGPARTETK